MNKIMNKIIKGAVAALTAIAGFAGAVAPVAAEGAVSDLTPNSNLTISVPGGRDGVYYFLEIAAAVGSMGVSQFAGKNFIITNESGSMTYTMPSDFQVTNICMPLRKGETLRIEDVSGWGESPYVPPHDPRYGQFTGFQSTIYPFYVDGQHFWNEIYHFSPVDAGYPDWLVQRWNTALAAYPALGSADAETLFFDPYDEGSGTPAGDVWIDHCDESEGITELEFAFTDNYQVADQDTVWNRTTDATNQMSFHIIDTVDDTQTYNRLQNVYIDGNTPIVSGSDYTKDHGSVIVNLQPNYLTNLADGEHTLIATFPGAKRVMATFQVTGGEVTPSGSGNYTPVSGDDVLTINKYLLVRSDATVPETTINFSVTPGTAIPAGNGKFEVLAGVGTPTVSSITYGAGDTASKQDTVTPGDSVVLDSGMSYVKKSVIADFSSVSFDEPGVYRYLLTEASTDEATFLDMDVQAINGAVAKQRVLDVYVIDDSNGNLVVDSYVLHEILGDIAAGADMGTDVASRLSDKSDGFVNRVVTYDLEAGHEATGNQASKDKFFKYTLALSGLQPNHTYNVDLSKASEQSGSNSATIADNTNQTNPATITTDGEGAATVDYYLNDGQYIKVLGLTRNSSYTLSAAEEDYKKSAGTDAPVIETKAHDDPTSGSFATLLADQYTGYTMTRSGIVPTGVFAGAAGALALVVFAFIFLMGKKRTAYDD